MEEITQARGRAPVRSSLMEWASTHRLAPDTPPPLCLAVHMLRVGSRLLAQTQCSQSSVQFRCQVLGNRRSLVLVLILLRSPVVDLIQS